MGTRPRILNLKYSGPGYVQVNMRGEVREVHLLVLEAFVGPRPSVPGCKIEARHLNDIGHDNRLENLAWGTQAENLEDSRRNGGFQIGERRWNSQASDSEAIRIRELYGTGKYLLKDLAQMFGISTGAVRSICAGDSYKHLPIGKKSTRLRLRECSNEIFRRVGLGENKVSLAKEFGISLQTVYGICYARGLRFSKR